MNTQYTFYFSEKQYDVLYNQGMKMFMTNGQVMPSRQHTYIHDKEYTEASAIGRPTGKWDDYKLIGTGSIDQVTFK